MSTRSITAAGARTLIRTAIAAAALAGCVHHDDVRIRVTRASGPRVPAVENLTVFVGGSKSWWPAIAPGESVSVVLPPEGDPPQATLIYTVAGTQRSWNGPVLPKGRGYLVAIQIAADGNATERHCVWPCALP